MRSSVLAVLALSAVPLLGPGAGAAPPAATPQQLVLSAAPAGYTLTQVAGLGGPVDLPGAARLVRAGEASLRGADFVGGYARVFTTRSGDARLVNTVLQFHSSTGTREVYEQLRRSLTRPSGPGAPTEVPLPGVKDAVAVSEPWTAPSRHQAVGAFVTRNHVYVTTLAGPARTARVADLAAAVTAQYTQTAHLPRAVDAVPAGRPVPTPTVERPAPALGSRVGYALGLGLALLAITVVVHATAGGVRRLWRSAARRPAAP